MGEIEIDGAPRECEIKNCYNWHAPAGLFSSKSKPESDLWAAEMNKCFGRTTRETCIEKSECDWSTQYAMKGCMLSGLSEGKHMMRVRIKQDDYHHDRTVLRIDKIIS